MSLKSPTTTTHLVLKIEDCYKYLNPTELQNLLTALETVGEGRKSEGKIIPEYLVVNTDEPYAGLLFSMIQAEEIKKKRIS